MYFTLIYGEAVQGWRVAEGTGDPGPPFLWHSGLWLPQLITELCLCMVWAAQAVLRGVPGS